jgi:hypothetical protein
MINAYFIMFRQPYFALPLSLDSGVNSGAWPTANPVSQKHETRLAPGTTSKNK